MPSRSRSPSAEPSRGRFGAGSARRISSSGLAGAPFRWAADIGDGLAEGTHVDGTRGTRLAVVERQERHHQLGEAIGLFEMRVTREDKAIDAKFHVFAHALRYCLRTAGQGRP